MYLYTQLHYTQNADDNSLCRLNIKARMLCQLESLFSLYSEAIEFLPFRHSISGTPLRDAVLPSGKSSLLLIHPPVFLYPRVLLRFCSSSRRRFVTLSSCLSYLSSPTLFLTPLVYPISRSSLPSRSLLSEKIISFIAIPLLRFLFMRQTIECSFLGARGHADSRNDNKSSSATTISTDMIISRVHFLLLQCVNPFGRFDPR